MSLEENKTVVRRFFEEVFNQQSQVSAAALIATSFIAHHPAFPQGIQGVEGIMQMTGMFRAGFPDLHYHVEDLVAEADKVGVRWTAHGTHQGPFMGVPASGKQVVVTGIDIFRVGGSQVVEAWVNSDFLGLMQQIGAVPPPPGGGS